MSNIRDILYVRFKVSNLEKQEQFLKDFGFQTERHGELLLARGTDSRPYVYIAEESTESGFVSVGFEAESASALENIAAIDGVSIKDNTLPGGGLIASLSDPNGLKVEIVVNIKPASCLPIAGRSGFNSGSDKQRVGDRVEFTPVDCFVKRLGHIVFFVKDFSETFSWYEKRLGLLISDQIVMNHEGVEQTLGAFTRCNRGDEYVDHHTMFFIHAGKAEFNHAAFEVENWDVLMKGHYELKKAGYEHAIGVGKHLLGSQVFDYWKDPDGFMLEHFTDGDLFNESFGSHKRTPDDLVGSFWGPDGVPG